MKKFFFVQLCILICAALALAQQLSVELVPVSDQFMPPPQQREGECTLGLSQYPSTPAYYYWSMELGMGFKVWVNPVYDQTQGSCAP